MISFGEVLGCFVAMGYVIVNFSIVLWRMVLTFILAFSCNAFSHFVDMGYGIMEHDMARVGDC